MDTIPRQLSRAQTFDSLSSQANIAGYRAIIEAGNYFGEYFGALSRRVWKGESTFADGAHSV